MKIYINGSSAISACQVFQLPAGTPDSVNRTGDRLKCSEPDYDKILGSAQIRRLSRILKMGLATSLEAIKQANSPHLDAIITGTGYGFLEDTARFLFKMTDPNDRGMNPTSFIQSTFNTISSLIALNLRNNGYNNTYTHTGFSFESALDDAIMLIKAGDAQNVLVGGLDELTNEVYDLLKLIQAARIRASRKELTVQSSGIKFFGEGSSFFVLADNPDSLCNVEITGFTILYNPGMDQIISCYKECIRDNNIDLFLLGRNGISMDDESYKWIVNLIGNKNCFDYKELCGDYPTAFSFGMWLATSVLSGSGYQLIPSGKAENVLLYNCFEGKHHAFMSLRKFR
jgi:3-oxoacyl-[acyl-carrier-protein] synthase II